MELESVNFIFRCYLVTKKKKIKTGISSLRNGKAGLFLNFLTNRRRMLNNACIILQASQKACRVTMAMWYDWNATLFHQNIPKCWTAKRKWTRLRYDAAIQCRWYFSRFVRWLVTGRSTTKNMRESMRPAHFSLLSSIHRNLIRSSVVERLKRWTQCNPEAPSSSPTLTAGWICC